MMKIATLRERL